MRKIAQAVIAAAVGLILVGAKANAQDINVVINGQPVAFTGTPPQELNGSVLVPLRGVFEQLGAHVQYNPSTKTIFAEKGSKTVSLSLGSTTAYVDNQPQQLSQPPTVLVGTTLVPLRFVAEAFGAYVEWQAQTSTVEIQTSPSAAVPLGGPPNSLPDQHRHADQNTISGRIINEDTPGNPDVITVRTPSGPAQVNIDAHTKIFTQDSGGQPTPVDPEDLRVGDDVTAQVWPNGNARSIQINFLEHHGRVVTVHNRPDGRIAVVLDDGQTVLLDPHVVVLHHHHAISRPVQPGDSISIRLRSAGGRYGYSIDLF